MVPCRSGGGFWALHCRVSAAPRQGCMRFPLCSMGPPPASDVRASQGIPSGETNGLDLLRSPYTPFHFLLYTPLLTSTKVMATGQGVCRVKASMLCKGGLARQASAPEGRSSLVLFAAVCSCFLETRQHHHWNRRGSGTS